MDYEAFVNKHITVRIFIEEILFHEDILDEPLRGFGVRSDNKYVVSYGRDRKEILIDEYKK